jgi:cytidyltransferase-like protein
MKVGVFTGKFKPPHAGHYQTILQIADENDETHVFVSPKTEGGITGEMAVEILNLYFSGRPDVQIHLSTITPVRAAYEFIEELGKEPGAKDIDLTVYALAEDLIRFGSVEKWKGNLGSVTRTETARPDFGNGQKVSGTLMREFVKAGDKLNFVKGLPDGVDKDRVWEIVTNKQVEEQGTWAIPASSFTQQIDPNIMPTDVNVPVGGLPSHWTTSQPYSRWDLKTNPFADRYGRNPKSRAVKSFAEFCKAKGHNK